MSVQHEGGEPRQEGLFSSTRQVVPSVLVLHWEAIFLADCRSEQGELLEPFFVVMTHVIEP